MRGRARDVIKGVAVAWRDCGTQPYEDNNKVIYEVILLPMFLFKKNISRLMRLPSSLSMNILQELKTARTNLYETWYTYRGTYAHLNGVFMDTCN
jgi:hypothetical protein